MTRLSKDEYARYDVKPSYFRGNKQYGRTTTIIDKRTGRKKVFMGILTKGNAIKQFKGMKK